MVAALCLFTAYAGENTMAKLLYQGHASYRITTAAGVVVYIDPYAGTGYDVPADIILVTHEHYDHNKVSLVTQKKSCRTIRARDMLIGGDYKKVDVNGIGIQAVPAYNKNHNRNKCVGYILTLEDGVTVYAAGDTSYTDYMKDVLPGMHLDYAFLPCDGVFNMDAVEAGRCADIIGAKHSVPIHTKPGKLFDRTVAERFTAKNRLILEPGEEISLEK